MQANPPGRWRASRFSGKMEFCVQEERPFSICGVAEQVVAAGRLIPAFSLPGDARGIALPQDARRYAIHRCRPNVFSGRMFAAAMRRRVGRAGWMVTACFMRAGRPALANGAA